MIDRKSQPLLRASRGEKIAAALAAAACLFLTVRIWSQVAASQTNWLFPALYFIELAALPLARALTYGLSSSLRSTITWGAVGVLRTFSVLGTWTVGLYYVPVAALFLALAVRADLRHGRPFRHAGVALLAALAQSGATLRLARLF